MKCQVNGVSLNVQDQGHGELALVFLHYWGGSSRTWSQVIPYLEDQFRCIAYDHRGWGESAPSNSSSYRIADLADDAAALIRTLGFKRYVLIGHSMGGKTAQLLASKRPSGLEALILVAPSPPVPMAVPEAQRKQMIEAYGSHAGIEPLIEHVLTAVPLSEDVREMIIEDTLKGAPAAKRAWPEAGMIEDISDAVANINVPTLVLAGENDQVERVEVLERELIPRVPGSQLHIIRETGHLSPLEAPDKIAAEVRGFLAAPA
jgi:pimeloyl-ACP methyl ester carboxylesterase